MISRRDALKAAGGFLAAGFVRPDEAGAETASRGRSPAVTIAGGEHWYTRWPVKAFLDRKCVDYVQSDPVWCAGISEWLKVCELIRQYPGVKIVPHITSPWAAAPHCVASQPEALCPLLEFNYEGGREALESLMMRSPRGDMLMRMPDAPGIS